MRRPILFTMALVAAVSICRPFKEKEPTTRAELGERLFFDPMLSSDRRISCASCHRPEFAFADTAAVSKGVHGRRGDRNTPSAMNMSLQRNFFWDGRASTLEQQALMPIENPREMNLPIAKAIQRLKNNPDYRRYFLKIFGEQPNSTNLALAIAAFERTLETSDSPFDEWRFTGNTNVVSEAARRGFVIFNGKGKCSSCHFGGDFTANEFRNIGLFDGRRWNDLGRALISRESSDAGKFKTPALRNVALTAPYMHNGRFRSLGEVIDFYNEPAIVVPGAIGRDTLLKGTLGLTKIEKQDLEAFLLSLTDKRFRSETNRNMRPAN